MHALRKYVQEQMDDRGWRPADLVTASGISKQVISGLLADPRDHIDRMPSEKTIAGLCRAFSVPRQVLLAVVGEAMGLPISRPVEVADASRVSNDELIRELARRLQKAGGEHDQRSASMNQTGTQPAHNQTRETTPASTASERLTEDESNVHTAAGEGDRGESSKLERLRQLRSDARSFTATGAPASAASADEPVDEEEEERVARAREAERARREQLERDATSPPPGLVADLPNGVAAFLGRDALRGLGIDTREPEADPAPPLDAAARDVGKPSRGQQIRDEQDAASEDNGRGEH